MKVSNGQAGPSAEADSVGTEKKSSSSGTMPCKFWGTDGGCRKGDGCQFMHSWDGLQKTSRCFHCSATGHMKRECPYRKSPTNPGAGAPKKQVAKVKGSDRVAEVTPDTPEGPEAAGADAPVDSAAGGTKAGTNPAPKVTAEEDETAKFLKEATGLLKSLRSRKALQLKCSEVADDDGAGTYALLDGGATRALRTAGVGELEGAEEVEVELAQGTAVMYRRPRTSTLLSSTPVEPIIPLRLLIDNGFSVSWDREGCRIRHGQHELRCWSRSGCPVMQRSEGLKLLAHLESVEATVKVVRDEAWWREHFPSVPDQVLRQ